MPLKKVTFPSHEITTTPQVKNIPDITHLTEVPGDYLIRQRIENLREKIDKTVFEILELQKLEALSKEQEIASNLGQPTKLQHLIAALEEKRTGMYKEQVYDGTPSQGSYYSVNNYYTKLFTNSFLNVKSFSVLSQDRKPIYTDSKKKRYLTIFDLFPPNTPKLSFTKYVAGLWDIDEQSVQNKLNQTSSRSQWKLREQWQSHLDESKTSRMSLYQQLLILCKDIVTSPIFADIKQIDENTYAFYRNYQLRFTNKTAIFTLPISEFSFMASPCGYFPHYISFAVVLPEAAQEKQRFFRKGGSLKGLINFFTFTGNELSPGWCNFLQQLQDMQVLRIYHEILECDGKQKVRGYFISLRDAKVNTENGITKYTKEYLYQLLSQQLQKENCIVKEIMRFHKHYPQWMRNMGGLMIEEKYGKSMEKTIVSIDPHVQNVKKETLLFPQQHLLSLPAQEFEYQYLKQLRSLYSNKPRYLKQFAFNVCRGHTVLRCGCNGEHQDKCPVPILHDIFHKIHNSEV